MLRAELAAAKLQIAQLAGERDELAHEVHRLSAKPQQQDPSWWPPFLSTWPPGVSSASSSAAIKGEAAAPCATSEPMPISLAGSITSGKAGSMFAGFSSEALDKIRLAMTELTYGTGDTVLQQGEPGDTFYVVGSGEFVVLIDQKGDTPVFTYSAGGNFGELALKYRGPRKATIRCTVSGTLWGLHRLDYESVRDAHVLGVEVSSLPAAWQASLSDQVSQGSSRRWSRTNSA